jgi:hypothetical protein
MGSVKQSLSVGRVSPSTLSFPEREEQFETLGVCGSVQ